MKNESVLIGMSGGVDSSVTAHLLKEAGYSCIGCTMLLHKTPCGGEDHTADACAVARRLDIPFHIFDFQKDFSDRVIGIFISCYEAGKIPNPCIECNKFLKFGVMLDKALELGC